MLAGYTGKRSRSLSTADVYRIDSCTPDDCCTDGGDDDEMPEMMPRLSFSALRRQIRRPSTRPPPVPPKRSDSFCASASAPVRSYLSDDIRRQFEATALARESQRQQQQQRSSESSSPRSSNFVKKLVATLERRQKDNATATRDVYEKRSFREASSTIARVPSFDLSPRYRPSSRLEKLREAENEGDDLDSSSDADDYFSDVWPRHESIGSSGLPVICAYPTTESKPSNNRRSWARNVLASLINWRIGGKSLAKGSHRRHDYYAARESLGEEMRAFRRDTMPRLMEHAAANSRLPDLMLVKRRQKPTERPRRDTQDFAKLIRRPANERREDEEPSPRSLASIHPIYGASRAASVAQLQMQQPPPSPPLQTCTSPPPTIASGEHLLRPSRLRDLEKRMSQDCDANVQLRPSGALYDVPRSNRPVVAQEHASDAAHYQNVGQSASDDKRLSCNLFTTF